MRMEQAHWKSEGHRRGFSMVRSRQSVAALTRCYSSIAEFLRGVGPMVMEASIGCELAEASHKRPKFETRCPLVDLGPCLGWSTSPGRRTA